MAALYKKFSTFSQDDEIYMAMAMYMYRNRKKRKHRWWVQDIIQKRKQFGAYHHVVQELQLDEVHFKAYFRLSREQFRQVLYYIEETVAKINVTRETISPRERLAVCLRFLATGESYRSLSFNYRIGVSTIAKIIPEVCQAIGEKMGPLYLKMPSTEEEWIMIAINFMHKWQFPNCVGALDGKHVVLKAPANTGSLYYNYKGQMSLVLLALADAYLKFTYIDVGSYGRNSDGGIFNNLSLGNALAIGKLKLPEDEVIVDTPEFGKISYTIVADEAFPLQYHMMRPYPGKANSRKELAFNYRLSRGRRIIECSFGVLAARWRIYHTKIAVSPEKVKSIVTATIVLHNFLQISSTPTEITRQLEQEYTEEIVEGLQNLQHSGNKGGVEAISVREKITDYVNTYKLPWQDAYIDRGVN